MPGLAAVLLLLASFTAAGASQSSAPPAFRAGVDVVRVDALVTRHSRPVSDLGAGDFAILDNGVPQRADLVSVGAVPINLVLALDASQRVAGERLAALVAAGRSVVSALRPVDRAAVLTFSHRITERVALTGDRNRLLAGLSGLSGGGNTALYDAVYTGLLIGGSEESRSLLIVFSDGRDTSSWLEPDSVLDAAAHSNITVYGITPEARETEAQKLVRHPHRGPRVGELRVAPTDDFLAEITESTGGRLLASTQRTLSAAFVEALREFENRYLLAYVPTGVSDTGWHAITVRVARGNADVRARRGYWR